LEPGKTADIIAVEGDPLVSRGRVVHLQEGEEQA